MRRRILCARSPSAVIARPSRQRPIASIISAWISGEVGKAAIVSDNDFAPSRIVTSRAANIKVIIQTGFEKNAELKLRFEYEVMKLMSEVMAHTITLHLLDAPGRLSRFQRKHPELVGRIPKKELAAYLNLTPETLSRLKQKFGEI